MTSVRNLGKAAIACFVATLIAATSASAAVQTVETSVSLATNLSVRATSTDCTNNPGPWVTLSGVVTFGTVSVDLIFRNNVKGTHERVETTTVSAELDLEDDQISIPKQPVRGGTGGNPFIWIQFEDADGNAVSDEIFVGRCVQGLDTTVVEDMDWPTAATFSVEGDNCENNPGPYIYLSGGLVLGGMNARIIFRNNDNPVGGPHEAVVESSASVEIIPDGETLVIPKQPVLGGVGGNPKVWLAVGDEEFYLGRCVQDL